MFSFLFDTETDGLLKQVTVMHSLVLLNVDTRDMISCADQPGYVPIRDGLELLKCSEVTLIGHNIIPYDVPVTEKLYEGVKIARHRCFDTLTEARKLYPKAVLWDDDLETIREGMPASLRGSHKLAAWGWRLGVRKDTFGETADWSRWTPEMQTYCEQDCWTNLTLFEFILGSMQAETVQPLLG